ncbi:right-handed parallel beta-helix repeat-containing protein [Paenibacillus sp. YN15]|uniref:right-handed parallel beta-helix repeat-containing protein n=1 Tax=Paenibacillus sp. YN15 TaxID=1742774 RepID=UPI000DCC07B9|nr:right-handed parallel beta-helix repeat-containing protein [Paenibacillus sp. YN15]RAU94715.1 hypothetical protein DQG13_23345 [Paenibacillus sp. YN15]
MVRLAEDAERDVLVRDFGAVPDDPADQAAALRAAIAYAAAHGKARVLLEAGRYSLHSFVVDSDEKHPGWCMRHLWLCGAQGLTLEGATDANGRPATVLAGCHAGENEQYLPAILWADRCAGLQLRNLAFTRDPVYSSAGVVVGRGEDYVVVDVFEGNPHKDGMACFCANRFDLQTKALLGESVTYGQGAEAGAVWRSIEGGEGRRLRLDSAMVAGQVKIGEGFSWHMGANTEFQVQLKECRDLILDNLHTSSSNGFAMQTECCRNVKASRIRFQPEGNLLFTAPRDAWKMYKCEGVFEIEHMYVEGVRMDGQNMHSTFLLVDRILDDRRLRLWAKWSYAPLRNGSTVSIFAGSEEYRNTIRSWRPDGQGENGHYYWVELAEPVNSIPFTPAAHMVAACWEPESYTIRSSAFRNIAGCGHIVKHRQVTIEDVDYRNLMNPGILIGAEWTGFFEGGHPGQVTVRRCTFDNCGYTPRCGATGGIGIRTEGLKGFYNKDIVIEDCTFWRVPVGVDVHHAENVRLTGNIFPKGGERYWTDSRTTKRIVIEERE